eukprot:scaffold188_cov429-Prasinococcus_capsulatus_cf.AAC.20
MDPSLRGMPYWAPRPPPAGSAGRRQQKVSNRSRCRCPGLGGPAEARLKRRAARAGPQPAWGPAATFPSARAGASRPRGRRLLDGSGPGLVGWLPLDSAVPSLLHPPLSLMGLDTPWR